jgi:8-oxo-dGTP diphosphatase
LRHGDAVLLIEGSRRKRWAGKLQGVGGGVRPGEDPLAAAAREIEEETGLRLGVAHLRLKGVIHSQNWYGRSKVMLIVVARAPHRKVRGNDEGALRWIPLRTLARQPNLVPDLYRLIPQTLALRRGELLTGVAVHDGLGRLRSLTLQTVRS